MSRVFGIWLIVCLATGCDRAGSGAAVTPPPEMNPATTEGAQGPPLFEDVTARSGIAFTYRNGEDTANHLAILESLGGGAALLDFDGDGLLDVFVVGGGVFDGADKLNIRGAACKLYRNRGGLTFEDVTAAAGLDTLAEGRPWFYSHGVAVADYDRDGWPDLLVTGWRAVALFRNVAIDPQEPKKGRRFKDVTDAAGLGKGIEWATGAAFGDLDGDRYPDLYLCQYVDWSFKKNPPCTYDGKIADVCPPRQFDGLRHKLYRNTGTGAFEDRTAAVGLAEGGPNSSKGLGVVIADMDGDSRPDIYVANDTVDNFFYLNRCSPGHFELNERGLVCGVARDDRGGANGSMGVDIGDPERQGKASLWVTNYENELHALYRNNGPVGQPFFSYRTTILGIAAIGQRYVGWGTAFVDVDLDGWEDLLVANGHAIRFPKGKDSNRKQRPVLLHNRGGKFQDISSRLGTYYDTPRVGRGVAFGAIDNDGRTDAVISHMNEPVTVLRGRGGEGNHWLGIELRGLDHGCCVGARVLVQTAAGQATKFAKGGGSYLSANDSRMVVGLGTEKTAQVTITWPDGAVQQFRDLAIDRYHRLEQPPKRKS